MKPVTIALLILIAFATLAVSQEGGGSSKVLLVKISDRSGKTTHELMSPSDYQQLLKQIGAETKAHPKALTAAETAWKKDEKKGFPKAAIAVRKATVAKEFTDSSKASDALSAIEERESDREASEKEKMEARDKAAIEKKTKTKEQVDKEKRKDAERESLYNSARSMYEEKLNELMSGGSGGGEGGDAKEEGKEEAKPKEEKKGK